MRRHLPVILVFAAILGALIYIEARPQFPDPDSFYHAKMALIIRDQGFIHQFPWLQETVLADDYVDHHLLYHILLIPFVTLFDPLVGMKVSAVVFGLLAFYVLYRVLRSLKAPAPHWLTFASALSFSFLHRMSLPRAPSLSLAFLLVGVLALLQGRQRLLFVVAFSFVWLYNGWPLLFVAYGCVLLATLLTRHLIGEGSLKDQWKTGGVLLLGTIAGLVINPYFPKNISFDFLHILKIGVINYQSSIPVGREWSPMDPSSFLEWNVLPVVVFVLATALLLPSAASHPVRVTKQLCLATFTSLLLAVGFFAMTLKSNRYVEYSVPFFILSSGLLFVFSAPFIERELVPLVREWTRRSTLRTASMLSLILISFLYFYSQTCLLAIPGPSTQTSHYQGATNWLKANVPIHQTVFNNAWDSSLVLFYLDDLHYYLIGLDPRFMYDADPERYQIWFDLVSGVEVDMNKVKDVFGAETIFIDRRIEGDFVKNIQASGLFTETYTDEWTHIFRWSDSL